jgi:hypothetical protein
MKYLILLLISFSVSASFMSKDKMLGCNKSNRTVFVTKKKCKNFNNDCKKVPDNYNCKTFSEMYIEVDDITKPNYSKSETEVCLGKEDCQTKIVDKSCLDNDERVIISEAYDEIYCSKLTGYDQKKVKRVSEDPVKKAANDVKKANKAAKKANKNAKFEAAKSLLEDLRGNETITPAKQRILLLGIMERLEDLQNL